MAVGRSFGLKQFVTSRDSPRSRKKTKDLLLLAPDVSEKDSKFRRRAISRKL
jgi:hypothetical protein